MKLKPVHILLGAITSLSLASCEDPRLVQKHSQQEAELTKLRGEFALLEERLKTMPEDQSLKLKEARLKQQNLEAELESLDSEVVSLEEEKKKLEEDYKMYQSRYVVP